MSWNLPSLAPGATYLFDVTVAAARQGYLAQAALASSTRFVELDAAAWSNNTVRVIGAQHLTDCDLRSGSGDAFGQRGEAWLALALRL